MVTKNDKLRLLQLLYEHTEGHIGSCFGGLEIIDGIYNDMSANDIFILSSGHLGFALYTIIEKYKKIDAQLLVNLCGVHPVRAEKYGIYCSTGSLGAGITIAVGRAIANKNQVVHVLISDGETAEGSVWESLRYIHDKNINNIKVYCNINGYTAYESIDMDYLEMRLKSFLPTINICRTKVNYFPFLHGINAHYHIMSEIDYTLATNIVKNEY